MQVLVNFQAERWDVVDETDELGLDLVVVCARPLHRSCNIEIELPHGNRHDIKTIIADCLLLVI